MEVKSFLRSILDKVFSQESWVVDAVPNPKFLVAAGNPSSHNTPSASEVYTEAFQSFTNGKPGFIVAGNSMSPKGIRNGDAIKCISIPENERKDIKPHKFIVIKVDKGWYITRRQTPTFDYKLRYSIAQIPPNSSFNEVYENLMQSEDSVLVPDNKKELQRKYEEAVKYYGKDTPLILSLTYKKGITHYSIHPTSLAEFEVIELGQRQPDGKLVSSELSAA